MKKYEVYIRVDNEADGSHHYETVTETNSIGYALARFHRAKAFFHGAPNDNGERVTEVGIQDTKTTEFIRRYEV